MRRRTLPLRLRATPILLLIPLSACSCDENSDPPTDASVDSAADAPDDARPDGDGGRSCTQIFSDPAGEPAATPGNLFATGEFDVMDDPATITESDSLFPLAVQSGEMQTTSAVVWTRANDLEGAELSLIVWQKISDSAQVARVLTRSIAVEEGGFVHERVDDLSPSTVYYFAFVVAPQVGAPSRSPVGRFRTAFAAGATAQLTVGATTCTGAFNRAVNEAVKPYPALSEMAKMEVDAILHLGDISYNDGSTSLSTFHAEWEETLSQQGYRDFLPSAGMYAIWDDHEIDNDWNAESSETVRTAGRTAFNQFLATERTGNDRLWTNYAWGDTAEFFLLDVRSERRPSTRESDAPVFVSTEQMQWLQEGLRDSTAHFKVVMTSVTMANLQGSDFWDTPLARNDRWEGYGTQREALLDFVVEEEIDNVWFLSGDIHSGFVGRLEPEGHPYARMWEIVVGPGASNVNPITVALENGLVEEEVVFPCNQFVYFHGRQHVETYLTFDPGSDSVRVVLRDGLTGAEMYDAALRQEPR